MSKPPEVIGKLKPDPHSTDRVFLVRAETPQDAMVVVPGFGSEHPTVEGLILVQKSTQSANATGVFRVTCSYEQGK